MQNNPESREYYKAFIKNFFERNGNKLREDLEKLYIVRGENCQRLEQQGRALEYDRVAVLYVSLTVLNTNLFKINCRHWRQLNINSLHSLSVHFLFAKYGGKE